MATVPR
jgi:hypothetical protein